MLLRKSCFTEQHEWIEKKSCRLRERDVFSVSISDKLTDLNSGAFLLISQIEVAQNKCDNMS